ncbi:MAG: MarR family winged helix-turn-helix transcriptional regulator [Planctomycetota bacterium]
MRTIRLQSRGVHENEPESMDLEDLIVAAVRRLMRAVDLHSRRLVDEYGLTGPQLATLQTLQRRGPTVASNLARAVHLSGATMTGILNRLEKRGFVERTRGQSDRRTVQVSITAVGDEVLARAPSLLQDRFRKELSHLETWEQLMMLANLQRIASMMDAEQLDAAPHLVSEAGALDQPTTDLPQPPSSPEDPRRN